MKTVKTAEFSNDDIEKFGCKNLIFLCENSKCKVPVCLKCLNDFKLKNDGQLEKDKKIICPTCNKEFDRFSQIMALGRHVIVEDRFPSDVVTKYQFHPVQKFLPTASPVKHKEVKGILFVHGTDIIAPGGSWDKWVFPFSACSLCMNPMAKELLLLD